MCDESLMEGGISSIDIMEGHTFLSTAYIQVIIDYNWLKIMNRK